MVRLQFNPQLINFRIPSGEKSEKQNSNPMEIENKNNDMYDQYGWVGFGHSSISWILNRSDFFNNCLTI